jgi:lipid II:glycine glycyltransferase (peptidoglycan interpeptide bridge formation enzyme)
MNLIELTEEHSRKYNDFVSRHSSGSFLQAWEWGQLQHEYSNKKIFRFFVEEGSTVLLAAQAIRTPLFAGQFYIYIPYGPVVASENDVDTFQFFLEKLKERFSSAVCIRIEPKYNPPQKSLLGKKTINIQPGKTVVVNLAVSDEDLMSAMHPKTRYNIKVAQKHGVDIHSEFVIQNGHGLYYKEAIELILSTAKRQGYVTHPFSYYEKIVNFFAINKRSADIKVAIYKAIYKRALVATAIIVDFGKTRTYLFGGSSPDNRNVMAPHLLHFQAMIDAKANGLTEYDFDGIETSVGKEAGFARFKLGFGGHIVSYSGAYDLVLHGLVYKLYVILRWLNRFIKKMRY